MNKKQLTNALIDLYAFAFLRGLDSSEFGKGDQTLMMQKIKPLVAKILKPVPTPRQRTVPLAKDGKAHGGSVTITNPRLLEQLEELFEREAI